MRAYKILAVCEYDVATSTIVSEKCHAMFEERTIKPIEVLECKVPKVIAQTKAYQPAVTVHTTDVPYDELK